MCFASENIVNNNNNNNIGVTTYIAQILESFYIPPFGWACFVFVFLFIFWLYHSEGNLNTRMRYIQVHTIHIHVYQNFPSKFERLKATASKRGPLLKPSNG